VADIEVFADIWCPFTHVGLRVVMRRREEFGRADVAVRVRAWPLELVNGAPLDPTTTGHHIEELRRQVAPDLFAGFDPARFPTTTLPALALASAAYGVDAATGERVSLALREALFEEGRDIADPGVLADVAAAYGLPGAGWDEGPVLADWREGQARRVKGSPHFFCGEVEAFCPSLTITRDAEGHLHVHRDVEALDRFLEECFGQ
jgi:2-hydroxychromene-2-carboxylate isomerase